MPRRRRERVTALSSRRLPKKLPPTFSRYLDLQNLRKMELTRPYHSPLNPLGNPTGDQSEGQAAYGYAGFNECAQGASTLAANSSKKILETVTLK